MPMQKKENGKKEARMKQKIEKNKRAKAFLKT